GSWFELTHVSPKTPSNDTVRYTFRYIAPSNAGSVDTIFANGNSVNLSGTTSGDQWNFAGFKVINITTTSVREINELVSSYNLSQNFPNPFNPSTSIRYGITKSGFVSMKVYDASGREVADLVNKYQNPGSYEVNFAAGDYNLSSGVYYYRLTSGDFSEVKKMILTK
ncbi:MAG: T9SS type A sorting domain-containing protein, partial [Ignavibacteria bacterium]|nr:T9SS type A sorting domain-containing protein [Ignavibacteria bacterium]